MSIGKASRKLGINYSTAKSIVQKMRKRGKLLKKSRKQKVKLFKVINNENNDNTSNILIKSEEEFEVKQKVEVLEEELIKRDSIKVKKTLELKREKKLKSKMIFPKNLFSLEKPEKLEQEKQENHETNIKEILSNEKSNISQNDCEMGDSSSIGVLSIQELFERNFLGSPRGAMEIQGLPIQSSMQSIQNPMQNNIQNNPKTNIQSSIQNNIQNNIQYNTPNNIHNNFQHNIQNNIRNIQNNLLNFQPAPTVSGIPMNQFPKILRNNIIIKENENMERHKRGVINSTQIAENDFKNYYNYYSNFINTVKNRFEGYLEEVSRNNRLINYLIEKNLFVSQMKDLIRDKEQ